MSLRAFKRLFGETSLERKTRLLLGGGILALTSLSFWLYARQTEQLAFDQLTNQGRLLVQPSLAELHLQSQARGAMKEFNTQWEKNWLREENNYNQDVLKINARNPRQRPNGDEQPLVEQFRENPARYEAVRWSRERDKIYYYAPIRAERSCLDCHNSQQRPNEIEEMGGPLKEGDLMAVFRFDFNTEAIRGDIHMNRAWLITYALVTALLIMAGAYFIIRQVIVKPVKHLKEVTNAVADGKLTTRSDLHTNDEFEDLSYAFNRMLINLVSMQDRLKQVNAELDGKLDELARANMALYESNRVKSEFLATMSHELRTPLNSILGFSDLLLNSPNLPDRHRRWVENVQKSGQQLLGLINDILDLTKVEAGKMQVKREEFALAEVSDGVLGSMRPLAEKKNIDMRQQIPADLPKLQQDAGKLRQILSNLVSNALKFTPEGGRVLVKARTEDGWLVLDVVDNGVGIAPEDREAIFEKFRQAGRTLTREHEGSGLGLSIVREISKLLGGDVSLHSELGRGSTFTIRLPLELPVTAAPPLPPPEVVY
jgi:signal transduction histidine kinase